MFVFNCNIDFSERLQFKVKKTKSKKADSNEVSSQKASSFRCQGSSATDSYYNVKCAVCKTQIAVYDENEVYHFFNVLASFT